MTKRVISNFAPFLLAGFVFAGLCSAPTQAFAKFATIVVDARSGQVLHEVNADTRNYPASLTKTMTLYMVFGALREGRLEMDQHLVVSARAARQPSSKLGLEKGQTITVKQAILAMVTKSANDVAVVIAETLGGNERDFALAMTAKARKIGMSRTTFRNASGLPHRGQLSTARDMATLARRLLADFPKQYRYFATSEFYFDGALHKNHNKLLKNYDGADGIKTGYIRASGFNLVASAQKRGQRLIGVIFGGRSPNARDRLMTKILDKSFRKLGSVQAVAAARPAPEKRAEKPSGPPPGATAPKLAGAQYAWGIQVGAYRQYNPARELADSVLKKLPRVLVNGTVKIVPLKVRNRRAVYRARITGLKKAQAYQACRILKQRQMDCMELRTRGVQVAAAN